MQTAQCKLDYEHKKRHDTNVRSMARRQHGHSLISIDDAGICRNNQKQITIKNRWTYEKPEFKYFLDNYVWYKFGKLRNQNLATKAAFSNYSTSSS